MMLEGYVPILILLIFAVLASFLFTGIALLQNSKNPSEAKTSTYEGGVPLLQQVPNRFPVKFLEVAMLFLIFDIETVAFFPWAVLLNQLKVFGLVEMGLFLLVLGVGYIYLLKKGAFKWD